MSAIWLIVFGLVVFILRFRFFSKFIAERVYRLQPNCVTPAHQFNDGVDFVPTHKWVRIIARHIEDALAPRDDVVST